jgi:putative SOS response-associated peptidase YedK
MPVVLRQEEWRGWLDPRARPENLREMLRPYEGGDLIFHPVSTIVNSPANDSEQCVLPLGNPGGE